jgi:predicted small secreted protein
MKRFLLVFAAATVAVALSGCDHTKTYDGHDIQAYCIMGVILLLSVGLGVYTNMLRDEISDCDQFDAPHKN